MPNSSLLSLNPEQRLAAESINGPVLILAGAGAGKTKTLTERIRHLIYKGIAPPSILAITFTNKAAKEMRERIEKGWQDDERPFISTFHSLGVHILREQAHRAGIRKHFTIFDRDDSRKAVREALLSLDLDPKIHEPARLLAVISKEKGDGQSFEDWIRHLADKGQGYFTKVLAQVWPEYEKVLVRDNALDFDDLLLKTMRLLEQNPDIRQYYQDVWQYIHIDEYQDTNRVQYEIARMLVGKGQNICVVGDVDQNIYSWRGADIRNILDFENDYPETQVFTLEENYRSTKNILEAANAVIVKNKMRRKKNLFTKNNSGEKIGLSRAFDETSEAQWVAFQTAELISKGILPDEIAVLYRANFQSRALEEAFVNRGLPYQLLGTRFFERREVKDVVSYLRAALNPGGLSDLKRIINLPARGIGKTSILKIFAGQEASLSQTIQEKLARFRKLLEDIARVSREKKPSETIVFIIKESGLETQWRDGGEEGEARLENAFELANFASRYDNFYPEEGILKLLEEIALQSDQDEMNDKEKAVRLMTVHAAKGLEFDAVFITGLEEGLFPHQEMNGDENTDERAAEERRLFYVALTRARKKIFLSYADTRTIFGRRQVNIPSEFIFDIPETLLEEEVLDEYNIPRKPLLEIEF